MNRRQLLTAVLAVPAAAVPLALAAKPKRAPKDDIIIHIPRDLPVGSVYQILCVKPGHILVHTPFNSTWEWMP